ncbi:MAG: carbohydrate ABC transporter permease [Roseburia sp.]|nr:carbohydrate ABC transporter permease [Roseburia sp.]
MRKSNRNSFKKSYQDKIFDVVNVVVMLVLLLIFVWPLWFVLIASVSNPTAVWNCEVVLWPVGFSMKAYKEAMNYSSLWTGYRNTIFYTVAGTLLNVVITTCAAYPLSRKEFLPRKFVLYVLLFTMYFSGGLIPTYLVVKKLGMIDTVWAMIIPGACSVYNVLVMRTYFKSSIPESLWEAAELDGANSFQYLIKILLPLSKPIIAVISLYYAVGHWNDYYTALVYIYDMKLMPLQSILKDLLMATQVQKNGPMTSIQMQEKRELAQLLKYCTIILASAPVLCAYPFVQKYFVKGVMIGSVKE